MINFDKWDSQIDAAAYAKEIKELEANGGNRTYDEVPYGLYEVGVEKLELVSSKKGDPMISCWFKILEGKYKNQLIFMNQVILQPFQIHAADEFLRQLDTDVDVEFTGSYKAYAEMIMDIKEEIDTHGLNYALEYGCNNKGYATFKIEEVFE